MNSNLPNLGSTIRVHIDTEFSDFINCDLLSIGAAADNGAEFYGENLDYIEAWVSKWVKSNVFPLFDRDKYGMKKLELSARLWSWLDELPCEFVVITYDYKDDYKLMIDLFGEEVHPKIIADEDLFINIFMSCDEIVQGMGGSDIDYERLTKKVRAKFDLYFMDYFIRTKETQHHALSDAKANREAYTKIVNEFGIKR